MDVLAIDPGTTESAWVIFRRGKVLDFGKQSNIEVLELVRDRFDFTHLAVEMIASYGMPVGAEIFQTVLHIGRILEAWASRNGECYTLIYRQDVKLHLCHQTRGVNDAVIRQALIDRFGPGKDKAIGSKKAPGPLYGIKADVWAALAVAVTWSDKQAVAV